MIPRSRQQSAMTQPNLQTRSLTRATLLKMSIGLTAIILGSAVMSYSYLMSRLEGETQSQLAKYIAERGKREGHLFELAEDNHTLLKQEFLKHLAEWEDRDPQAEFNVKFAEWDDGTLRNRLKDQDLKKFDTIEDSSIFIGAQAPRNADLRRRALTAYDLATQFGPAWQNRFVNTYFTTPENVVITYWPGVLAGLEAPWNTDFRTQEFVYIADRQHNPARKTVWTGLYLDQVTSKWLVSVATPIDDESGRHVATVGNDIMLNQLLDNTIEDKLPGTYNLVFRQDGRLIAHPDRMAQIQSKAGEYQIQDSQDPHLQRIYAAVQQRQAGQQVIENAVDQEYLAITQLQGPDWFFVTVYPKSLLTEVASRNVQYVLLAGFVALVLEILFLRHVFRKQVSQPLHSLITATEQVAMGEFDVKLDLNRRDELGRLAASFTSMIQQLQYSFLLLEKNNFELEQRVQARTEELNAIIDNLGDGLLVTNEAGQIVRLNPKLLQMFGLEGKELLGQTYQTIFKSDLAGLVTAHREQNDTRLTTEVELSDDRVGQALVSAIAHCSIPHSDRSLHTETTQPLQPASSIVLVRDITTEKEVDRMKTDFISTVSHELRTPLTSVLGFAKLIQKKLEDAILPHVTTDDRKVQRSVKQVRENLNIIVAEGERLTALINDVLDVAKIEAGKIEWNMQPLAAIELIERAIAATTVLAQNSGLQMLCEVEPNLPAVMGDRDRLIQVLINLISNAIKFTHEGRVICRAQQRNDFIQVSIVDNGIGIAEGDCEKVFEKFKQVGEVMTDKPKGTGLGLPICKQIVEHHGGRIWVESQIGQGSTFFFTLPLFEELSIKPTERLIHKPSGTQPQPLEQFVQQVRAKVDCAASLEEHLQAKILVVDDEPHIRSLLRQELESAGYQVQEAENGIEALQQIKAHPPDLIILDVMMPTMNGFDLAAVLKNNPTTSSIPTIILSIIQDKEQGYRLGIDRYLNKPIDIDLLLRDIRNLLAQGCSHKKVLVVDADIATAKTLTDVLLSKGYSVTEATTGQEGIQKALSIKPDMIIVDAEVSHQHNLVKTLRFDNGMENIFFIVMEPAQRESNS
jgi:PAS domain S-box-containing protein